nr:hypothetical protein [Sutcliffiella horikoshii]
MKFGQACKYIMITALLFSFTLPLFTTKGSAEMTQQPKHEMRAVWIATVQNIDGKQA